MPASRYETNIFLQPAMIAAILKADRPAWMDDLRSRPVYFVGVGTSFHLAQIAKMLWRRHVSLKAPRGAQLRLRAPLPAGAEGRRRGPALASRHQVVYGRVDRGRAQDRRDDGGHHEHRQPLAAGLTHRIEACETEKHRGVHEIDDVHLGLDRALDRRPGPDGENS